MKFQIRFNDYFFILLTYFLTGFTYAYVDYMLSLINLHYNWSLFPIKEYIAFFIVGAYYLWKEFIISTLVFLVAKVYVKNHSFNAFILSFVGLVAFFRFNNEKIIVGLESFMTSNCNYIVSGNLTECGRQNLYLSYWSAVLVSIFVCCFTYLLRKSLNGRLDQ